MKTEPDPAPADWLILVPTSLELELMRDSLSDIQSPRSDVVRLCGFGPVAAAANTMQLIHELRPQRVVLIGIAGSLREQLAPGSAVEFESVACDGLGVGEGHSFQSSGELGWAQSFDRNGREIGDVIVFEDSRGESGNQLLTVFSAASGNEMADRRMARFPNAVAEDMEGFGVALSAQLRDVPLSIIRGISNYAGDRQKQNWQIERALSAAVDRLKAIRDSR